MVRGPREASQFVEGLRRAIKQLRDPRITRRSDPRGIETIEAAVIVPIMLLSTMSVIQFGTLVYARQMAEEAARYGVRQGVVNIGNPAGGSPFLAPDQRMFGVSTEILGRW